MFSNIQIVNIGLSKIASSRIERIDPPRSSLERFVADNYEHWKRSEIAKRRWVFALEENYVLAKVDTLTEVSHPYKYSIPTDCLRPVRVKRTEWKQRGRFIYSTQDALAITYLRNAPEEDFDPLFVEVLACRVAMESGEYVTQSNTKKADAVALYDKAVGDAAKNNAFVMGPENITEDDDAFPFITARF